MDAQSTVDAGPDLRDLPLTSLGASYEAEAVLAGVIADHAVPVERPVRGFNSYVLTELD